MLKSLAFVGTMALCFVAPADAKQFNNGDGSITPGIIIESSVNPATIFAFLQTTTLSAAPLPSQVVANGVVCTALLANTGTVYVGASGVTTSTGYPLASGQSISYAATNTSGIYIIDTNTTDVIACTGN